VAEENDILPVQVPPEREPAFEPGTEADQVISDEMSFHITSWPPLNQSTTIPRHDTKVAFTVLVETNAASSKNIDKPEVFLWHNQNGDNDWNELHLKEIEAPQNLLLNRPADEKTLRHWYTANISGSPKHAQVLKFTIKFRVTGGDWRWVKQITGIEDGELHYQTKDFEKHSSHDLKHWFNGSSSDIQHQSETAETANTFLYSLSCPAEAAKTKSGFSMHQLGLPADSEKWFGLVRLWAPWLAPRQGGKKLHLDKDAILLSFLRSDGLSVVCLAISGVDDIVTTFIHDDHGNVIIKSRNDRSETGTAKVLVAVAEDFETANAAVMHHARKVVKTYAPTAADEETAHLLEDNVKPEWIEEWYDGLTYCTWNGLGQNLTDKKIYTALDSLKKEGIVITNLIIDDNWQWITTGETQHQRGWSSFEANKEGFPDGLKGTTTEIRKRHPNIGHIAVWHALFGYWGGVDPNGEIAAKYKTVEVEKEAGAAGGFFTVVAAEDAKRMYNDFYAFLSESGVDSVKTDAQFFIDLLLNAPDRKALTTAYQDAWTLAHLRHFSSRAISCMSQSPQILFYSQLPTNKPRLLVRNSDDFFPDIDASHPWHIFCNAHNSLLAQHLNVIPDWDMFQTVGSWSAFHAAARAVSGGPIYFTDEPGKHNFTLLDQMTARTVRGKTVILRPHALGKSIDPYNAYSSHSMLKIGTLVKFASLITGILGIFNVSKHTLDEFIPLHAFPGTEKGEYIIGSFVSDVFSAPTSREDPKKALVGLRLEEGGWDILTAYPLQRFDFGASKKVGLAALGLRGKMTGVAAVTGFSAYIEKNQSLRVWIAIKALGTLGIFISDLETRNVEEETMVLILGNPIPLACVSAKGKVLEIDVERAWKESGEDPGWSNEVTLEVFVNPKH
jgi:hypothetical protein